MSPQPPPPRTAQPFATGLRSLLALLLCLAIGLPAQPALALSDAQQLVVEAWRLVNQSYVDPQQLEKIHWRQLRQKALERSIGSSSQAYAAIESMLAPIGDPYTRMLRPQEYGALRSNTKGTVSGVGLQLGLRERDQQMVVISPLEDSPASEAGIVSGTELLAVDGVPTGELGLDGAAARLRGEAGSDVLLKLQPPGGGSQTREVILERREVDLQPVRSKVLRRGEHLLGYLRITQFSDPVPDQVEAALDRFSGKEGDDGSVEGLILDLRNNSGGLVSAGVAVANMVLDGEPIVETLERNGITSLQQASRGLCYGGPMVTLVNGGTASASEILAGALQDSGRSELAGSRTFGKGLIQTLISLGDGSGMAVTVARYLTPSGRDIQHQGIEPDLRLPTPEPLNPGGEGDSWLDQAAEQLFSQLQGPA
ncbi:MAG: carboxyl-terminal processing protease CtpZ [Cyanobacteriota bacterium]